jgi:hypothetical protein
MPTGCPELCMGSLLRLLRIAPVSAEAAIGVLSSFVMPLHWLNGGFAHMISLGWRENLLQAVLQGGLAGPAALYLFVKSIALIGAGRAAIFFRCHHLCCSSDGWHSERCPVPSN